MDKWMSDAKKRDDETLEKLAKMEKESNQKVDERLDKMLSFFNNQFSQSYHPQPAMYPQPTMYLPNTTNTQLHQQQTHLYSSNPIIYHPHTPHHPQTPHQPQTPNTNTSINSQLTPNRNSQTTHQDKNLTPSSSFTKRRRLETETITSQNNNQAQQLMDSFANEIDDDGDDELPYGIFYDYDETE